ncbi:hypothetical protein [Gilliamella apicola]|nr:hypothetical protein [Gilliamella apicola]
MSDSIEEAQSIMQKDPFYIHDLVDFEYTFLRQLNFHLVYRKNKTFRYSF